MTTVTTGPRAATGFPAFSLGGAGSVQVAYGSIAVSSQPAVNSIWRLCKLPAGAVVIGGELFTTDGDTGTEALDIDLGWAANGVETADPDGFVNGGIMTGDAITDLQAAGFNRRPFTLVPGAQRFSAETIVQAQVIAQAATFQAFTLSCVVYYVVP